MILEILAKHGEEIHSSVIHRKLVEQGVYYSARGFHRYVEKLEAANLIEGRTVHELVSGPLVTQRAYKLTTPGLNAALWQEKRRLQNKLRDTHKELERLRNMYPDHPVWSEEHV